MIGNLSRLALLIGLAFYILVCRTAGKDLQPLRTFHLGPELQGLDVRYMAAGPDTLYFLASPSPTHYNGVLVKTELTGEIVWKLSLGPDEVTSLQ